MAKYCPILHDSWLYVTLCLPHQALVMVCGVVWCCGWPWSGGGASMDPALKIRYAFLFKFALKNI